MSQENVETVRRLYGFWRDRDFSVIEDAIHPDAVIDVSRNVFNPGVHRGIYGLRRFVEQINEVWESFEATPEELIDAGDKVIVAHRISGKGRTSGVEADMRLFAVVTFRDGKILRFTGGLRDRAEALEAAGLSE
jgi:ketosteroid isomerase-like protein